MYCFHQSTEASLLNIHLGKIISVKSFSITNLSSSAERKCKAQSQNNNKDWTAEVENLFRVQLAGY